MTEEEADKGASDVSTPPSRAQSLGAESTSSHSSSSSAPPTPPDIDADGVDGVSSQSSSAGSGSASVDAGGGGGGGMPGAEREQVVDLESDDPEPPKSDVEVRCTYMYTTQARQLQARCA